MDLYPWTSKPFPPQVSLLKLSALLSSTVVEAKNETSIWGMSNSLSSGIPFGWTPAEDRITRCMLMLSLDWLGSCTFVLKELRCTPEHWVGFLDGPSKIKSKEQRYTSSFSNQVSSRWNSVGGPCLVPDSQISPCLSQSIACTTASSPVLSRFCIIELCF